VIKGKLYVAGGQRFTPDGPRLNRQLRVYDPVTNAWSEKAPIPHGVIAPAGALLRGRFYVIGGVKQEGGTGRLVQAYDPLTDTWELKARMPTGRIGLAAARFLLGGQPRIVAVGGLLGDPVGANEVYTP
jgi:N-acetylneuraminic acid mutarotase